VEIFGDFLGLKDYHKPAEKDRTKSDREARGFPKSQNAPFLESMQILTPILQNAVTSEQQLLFQTTNL